MQLYRKIILLFINGSSLFLGCYFLYNGIVNGIVKEKILSKTPDKYTYGSNAVKLGFVQLVLGLFVFASSIVFFLAILKDFF
jgi:hypothetical protein